MKIGTTIKPAIIAEAFNLGHEHGDNALRAARLIKKLCNFDDAEELYELLVKNQDLFSKRLPHVHDFLLDYRPKFWWETSLKYIDLLLRTHGVEGLSTEDYSCYESVASYCNAGDPYITTVIWDNIKKEFYIGNWGDLVEHYQNTEGWEF